jgi:hypothetical protein
VDNERLKSVHRGYFKIDEASVRSLRLSMSGPVAFEVSKVFNMSSTSISVIILSKFFVCGAIKIGRNEVVIIYA